MRKLHQSVFAGVVASAALTASAQNLEQLAWLGGCWLAEGREPGSQEQWMPPAGGTMLGMARTIKSGKTVEFEFMQIQANPDGKLVYIAMPSGQRRTAFTLKDQSPGEVTFENPEHDFPRRIIYRHLPGDRLAARIEGMRNGAPRGIDFPMQRASCDELARAAKP